MAWRDAFSALGNLVVVTAIAFLLAAALSAARYLFPEVFTAAGLFDRRIAGFAYAIVQAFLMTPFAIAVHRHVLLGEVTKGYSLDPSQPRFLRFFGFAALLHVLWVTPTILPLPGPCLKRGSRVHSASNRPHLPQSVRP